MTPGPRLEVQSPARIKIDWAGAREPIQPVNPRNIIYERAALHPPGVAKMPGRAPGTDQDDIEADIQSAQTRAGGKKGFGGTPDAPLLAGLKGVGSLFPGRAGLDLDDRNNSAAPGDDVDFPLGNPEAALKNTVTLGPEKPGGEGFGVPSVPPGSPFMRRAGGHDQALSVWAR